jgi:hypothetical protein
MAKKIRKRHQRRLEMQEERTLALLQGREPLLRGNRGLGRPETTGYAYHNTSFNDDTRSGSTGKGGKIKYERTK